MAVDEEHGFGALPRRHRTVAGLSQEALAERAGLSRRGIADLERGARSRSARGSFCATIKFLSAS
jgi:transcriptional regulator with XRE-family HTH domain